MGDMEDTIDGSLSHRQIPFPKGFTKGHHCPKGCVCHECSDNVPVSYPQCRSPFEERKLQTDTLLDVYFDGVSPEFQRYLVPFQRGLGPRQRQHHHLSCNFRPFRLCKILGIRDCPFGGNASQPSSFSYHLIDSHNIPTTYISFNCPKVITWGKFGSVVTSITKADTDRNYYLFEVNGLEGLHSGNKFLMCRTMNVHPNRDGDYSWVALFLGNGYSNNTESDYMIKLSIVIVRGSERDEKWKWTWVPSQIKNAEGAMKQPHFQIPLRCLQHCCKDLKDFDLVAEISVIKGPESNTSACNSPRIQPSSSLRHSR